jgi:membrane protein CcdC involved in cytochrome C biogenesis
LASIISIIIVIALVFWRRTKAISKPIKGKGIRILLPIMIFIIFIPLVTVQILFPQNGSSMNTVLLPSLMEIIISFVLGIMFAIPLVMTTDYEIREDTQIYAKKNIAFIYVLIGLIIIRFALKSYFSSINPLTLSLLSMILALGYVGVWRIASFIKFRKVWSGRISMGE